MNAALLALVLVAAGPSTPTRAPPLEVLESNEVDYDVAHERGIARGGVVLRRGVVIVRADTASYDMRTGEIEASGSVLLTEPGRVVAAKSMHLVLDDGLEAHDVVAFMKDTPLDLSKCHTLEEGRKTGRNRLSVKGDLLDRPQPPPGGPDRFELDHATVTMCDCGGAGAPPWQIRTMHADVIPGKRAILSWPVFYITPRFLLLDTPVPVFVFPIVYLPLGDRQTGLLFPELAFGGTAGFLSGISQPLFITLGRSWDATVTADYTWGTARPAAARGPGTSLELRWAPVEGMRGQIKASILHSQLQVWPDGVALPPGWNRIALVGIQDHRVSDQTYYRIELGLIDDALYLNDFTADALLRANEYRRSAIAVTHRTNDAVAEVDAAYHLPLQYLDSGGPPNARAPFGTFGADLSTFHRLPSASLTLLPVRLAGPVQVSGLAGVARFAPLHGATGDEGLDGIGPGERGWGPASIDAGERDGRWQGPAPGSPGERLAATRTLVRAELRAPVTWRSMITLEPSVTATAAAYAFEEALPPQVDARLNGALALSTRITRTYGQGNGRVRHEIEPRIEWRGGLAQAGPGLPNYAYDELDVALPAQVFATGLSPTGTLTSVVKPQRTLSAIPGRFSQLQLSVRNRLIAPAGPLSDVFADLSLGQDLDLDAGRASETWGSIALRLRNFSANAYGRARAFGAVTPPGTPQPLVRSPLDAFTELGGSASVADGRGDNVHMSFLALGAGASPAVVAGLEAFFDPRAFGADPTAQGTAGLTGRLSGAELTYDAAYTMRETVTCVGKSTHPHVYQHTVTFTWDSPCKCWKAGLNAVFNECNAGPTFNFILDFSSVGGRAISANK